MRGGGCVTTQGKPKGPMPTAAGTQRESHVNEPPGRSSDLQWRDMAYLCPCHRTEEGESSASPTHQYARGLLGTGPDGRIGDVSELRVSPKPQPHGQG